MSRQELNYGERGGEEFLEFVFPVSPVILAKAGIQRVGIDIARRSFLSNHKRNRKKILGPGELAHRQTLDRSNRLAPPNPIIDRRKRREFQPDC